MTHCKRQKWNVADDFQSAEDFTEFKGWQNLPQKQLLPKTEKKKLQYTTSNPVC